MTDDDDDFPVLPYNDAVTGKSSGWSGADTSQSRAHEADLRGLTGTRQKRSIGALRLSGSYGFTCDEMNDQVFVELDSARFVRPLSGVLSNLHKDGRIARMTGERRGQKVYMALECVEGRETEPYEENINIKKIAAMRRIVKTAEGQGLDSLPLDLVQKILNAKKKKKKKKKETPDAQPN